MVAAMTDAAGQAGVEVDALTGIGVGSPGDVDGERGTVTSARNLPDWEGEFALGAALEQALGTRTRLASDVGSARLRACVMRERQQRRDACARCRLPCKAGAAGRQGRKYG